MDDVVTLLTVDVVRDPKPSFKESLGFSRILVCKTFKDNTSLVFLLLLGSLILLLLLLTLLLLLVLVIKWIY